MIAAGEVTHRHNSLVALVIHRKPHPWRLRINEGEVAVGGTTLAKDINIREPVL